MIQVKQLPLTDPGERTGSRWEIQEHGKVLTFSEVIDRWQEDVTFQDFYTQFLAEHPFPAYFWEHPALATGLLQNSYELVLVESRSLARVRPTPDTFQKHWTQDSVAGFWNLGKNAMLVSPKPTEEPLDFAHLATFLRQASVAQTRAFWQKVGQEMVAQLQAEPRWLSTSGLGVHWLHVRIDQRPKYYTYRPYRNPHYLLEINKKTDDE